jgi:hypothetical protein
MSEQPQIIVEQRVPPDKPYGASNFINAKKAFPASPIHKGELTDNERKQIFDKLVLQGTIVGGNGINSFNRDFVNAPDLESVATGGGGLPATPYMPNITSPGPGSLNAADQPEFQGDLPNPEDRMNWGSGLGNTTSPSKTSKDIAKTSVLGSFISGRSFIGSDGKV